MPNYSVEFIRHQVKNAMSDIKTRLDAVLDENKKLQDAKQPEIRGVDRMFGLFGELEKLGQEHIRLFGDNEDKTPSPEDMRQFREQATLCMSSVQNLSEQLADGTITHTTVQEVGQYILDTYIDQIAMELKQFSKMKEPAHDWGMDDEQKSIADKFLSDSKDLTKIAPKLNERVHNQREKDISINNDETNWIMFPKCEVDVSGRILDEIPNDIVLSGDSKDIAAYYAQHPDLNDYEKDYLSKRIGVIEYFDQLEKENSEHGTNPVFDIEKTEKGLMLKGYEGKYQYQTTGQGCWSCAYAMLLESRGVSLNQHIIRMFRPDMGVDDVKGKSADDALGLLDDREYSIYEMGDLALKVLPKSALRMVTLGRKDPKNFDGLKEEFLSRVQEALEVHKSPVAVNIGGHYITVVGIDGEDVKILDSKNEYPKMEETRSAQEIVKSGTLSLAWIQDLEFTKDGRCSNIPDQFSKKMGVHYVNGRLANQGVNENKFNMAGDGFMWHSAVKNVSIIDNIYLPQSVPEKLIRLEAEKKAPVVENHIDPTVSLTENINRLDQLQTTMTAPVYTAVSYKELIDKVQADQRALSEALERQKASQNDLPEISYNSINKATIRIEEFKDNLIYGETKKMLREPEYLKMKALLERAENFRQDHLNKEEMDQMTRSAYNKTLKELSEAAQAYVQKNIRSKNKEVKAQVSRAEALYRYVSEQQFHFHAACVNKDQNEMESVRAELQIGRMQIDLIADTVSLKLAEKHSDFKHQEIVDSVRKSSVIQSLLEKNGGAAKLAETASKNPDALLKAYNNEVVLENKGNHADRLHQAIYDVMTKKPEPPKKLFKETDEYREALSKTNYEKGKMERIFDWGVKMQGGKDQLARYVLIRLVQTKLDKLGRSVSNDKTLSDANKIMSVIDSKRMASHILASPEFKTVFSRYEGEADHERLDAFFKDYQAEALKTVKKENSILGEDSERIIRMKEEFDRQEAEKQQAERAKKLAASKEAEKARIAREKEEAAKELEREQKRRQEELKEAIQKAEERAYKAKFEKKEEDRYKETPYSEHSIYQLYDRFYTRQERDTKNNLIKVSQKGAEMKYSDVSNYIAARYWLEKLHSISDLKISHADYWGNMQMLTKMGGGFTLGEVYELGVRNSQELKATIKNMPKRPFNEEKLDQIYNTFKNEVKARLPEGTDYTLNHLASEAKKQMQKPAEQPAEKAKKSGAEKKGPGI